MAHKVLISHNIVLDRKESLTNFKLKPPVH